MRYTQIGVVTFALALSVIGSVKFGLWLFDLRAIPADFTVFWTAARAEHVYDGAALTAAQAGLPMSGHGLRPFLNPPPALFLIATLRLLAFWPAWVAWTCTGLVAFLAASSLYGRSALLGVLSPAVAIALVDGQMSLLLGAPVAAGVALLDRRPIVAGVLFGIVGAMKPQLVMLVPVALLFGGHWRSLLAACVTGLSAITISLLLGPSLWLDWANSLPAFASRAVSSEFIRMNMAPGLWFAPLGVAGVAYVFRNTVDPALRLQTLVAGACICSPYFMIYDLAAAAPAAAVLMFKSKPRQWGLGCASLALPWAMPIVAIWAAVLAYLDRRKDHIGSASSARCRDTNLIDRSNIRGEGFG